MKNFRDKFPEEAWEKGELGATESYVRKVSLKREKAVDASLGLQMISLRLQKDLIEALKNLAHDAGIGYQPYIRQLLTHHVHDKKKRNGTYG